MINQSYVPDPVQTNPSVSALLAVAVSVGGVHPARLIVVNQVTVLPPVASCKSLIVNTCQVATLDKASVLLPHKVTVCTFAVARSKVIVAQSELAVTHCIEPLMIGFISVGSFEARSITHWTETSFSFPQSLSSAIIKRSAACGVTNTVSVGKMILVIVL